MDIPIGAIYRNCTSPIFVKKAVESDGHGGNFGPEYWRIESVENPWLFIGAAPFEMQCSKIEDSPEWKRVI